MISLKLFNQKGYIMNFVIPKISRNKVYKLRELTKPVARFASGPHGLYPHDECGDLYYIKVIADPIKSSYLMSPDPNPNSLLKKILAGEKCEELKPLMQIITHHTTASFCFSPTEAEVLAQIPEKILDQVAAYEILGCCIAETRDDSYATLQLYTKQ